MTQLNRAKIFAPFAALVGFDDRVRRKEISYVSKVELDADEEWELNRRLQVLHELAANSRLARANAVEITVEYFAICTDRENDAYLDKGQYLTATGRVLNVNQHSQVLRIGTNENVLEIQFTDIYHISDPDDKLF